jgi:hypothetical protein
MNRYSPEREDEMSCMAAIMKFSEALSPGLPFECVKHSKHIGLAGTHQGTVMVRSTLVRCIQGVES